MKKDVKLYETLVVYVFVTEPAEHAYNRNRDYGSHGIDCHTADASQKQNEGFV